MEHDDTSIFFGVVALVDNAVKELAAFEQFHDEEDLLFGFIDLVEPCGDLVLDDALNVNFFSNGLLRY